MASMVDLLGLDTSDNGEKAADQNKDLNDPLLKQLAVGPNPPSFCLVKHHH